ncbi:Ca2+-binding protein [Commensalibacter communis]|uniref:Hint domain-containing protein n=1 Tax=Commensalibacter communis TaxID=2972786 RepID=UPI0022FF6011|nr:Hint domain-containing protein [Commensalibacter communis]CAI3957704.1 Ca2+-binding protein [Commensalibacter communis]
MSDDNIISSNEQLATVAVATDDNVSSSLSDLVLGSSAGSLVSGGSLSSDSLSSNGSAALSDLVSAGELGSDAAAFTSMYSAAATSMLDQTFYAGSLNRAAQLKTAGMPDYNVVSTVARALNNVTISNAPNVGDTYKYTYNAVQSVTAYAGIGYNGSGHAIYQTNSAISVTSTGVTQIAAGNSLLVGRAGATDGTANFGLQYRPDGSANFIMDQGSYLSANGYVGGVADKSQAGAAVGAGDRGLRTGNVLAADNVSADVVGDWGIIGDAATGLNPTTNKFGKNAHLNIGGNLGIFMNASATYDEGLQVNVGGGISAGSGVFVGSGGYMSVGNNGRFNITGGMGAAYSGGYTGSNARMYLGSANSVHLDQANWGNFAAQAGAVISAGDDFNLRALEISVGYGQVASTGGILGDDPASMIIGSNAIISLAQKGLSDNGLEFYLGSDGAIVVDGSAANAISGNKLIIGNGAQIGASTISLGNYAKDYSGVDPRSSPPVAMSYSWYHTGNNNSITIGSGATINLSGGIELDGNNNVLTMNGGGTSGNILNAGYISAGRFYQEYQIPLVNSSSTAGGTKYNYVYDNTSGANVTFGDGYIITLTSGITSTGLANIPVISNNGNLMATANRDIFTFGSNVTLNANSVVVGDYSLVASNTKPGVNPFVFSKVELTSGASLTYGNNTKLNLSGAVLLNGSGNAMSFGDQLTANVSTMSFGVGPAGGVQRNNIFSAGALASITVSNGLSNSLVNGTFRVNNNGYIHLLAGDYVLNGAGTAAASNNNVAMGDNSQLLLDTGSILVSGQWQTFTMGATAQVSAKDFNVSGTSQTLSFGSNTTVNLNGATSFVGSANKLTFGDNLTFNGAVQNLTNGTGLNVTGKSEVLTFGNLTSMNLHNGNFLLQGSANQMNFGTNFTLNAGSMYLGSDTTLAGTQQGNIFSAGASASITLSNGLTNSLTSGTFQLNNNGYIHLLTGDYVLNGSGTGAAAAANNKVIMGDNSQLLLDTGSILVSGQWQNFTIGSSGKVVANTLSVGGTSQTFTFSNGANVTLNGGLVVDANTTTMTFGNDVALTVGTSGMTFNTSTQFAVGTGGSVDVAGDITFGLNAARTTFNVGANKTAFNARNIILNANSPALTFGAGINYGVAGWRLNGASNQITLGDGATGSIGDITIGGNATGAFFNTGNATDLSFGNATFINDAKFTLNGKVTGQSLSLAGTTTVDITAGANVNIGSLSLDGTKQVIINVAAGATLNVDSVSTFGVGSNNKPVINIKGGTVIVGGQKARALSSDQYVVDFGTAAQKGIYKYEGTIQENSGKVTLQNFDLTDEAVFEIGDSYLDPNRYQTSVVDGVLYVDYITEAGQRVNLAQFNYSPTVAGAVPNVVIKDDSSSSTGHTITLTKCFVTGTHILTPDGEVTVENLQVGDQVVTLQDGRQVTKTIVWAGHMDVDVNHYEHKDTLYPVCIKAHAFGLNQPCRDLLVTPEHTIYVDGGLIPARMLVNGRSIIVDKSMDRFTVYHIETEEHSILLSENLTTESYLNTDDRHLFNGDAVNLHLTFDENAGHQSWENDAAAPLTVARHQVEPIWQRLDRRATQQGYAPVIKKEITRNPDLCLITQKGIKLQPIDIKGNVYSFYVPANARVVAMYSKAALPSEVVGPFLDDRRMLGVLVAKISVLGEKSFDILPSDMTGLSGWHPAELNRTDRWTQGLATLPAVVSEMSNQVKLVKIELTTTAEYFVDIIECAEQIA